MLIPISFVGSCQIPCLSLTSYKLFRSSTTILLGKSQKFLVKIALFLLMLFSLTIVSWGALPPRLCSRFKLIELTIHGNNFTGGIPNCLKNCFGLVRLCFDENHFTGNISDAFGGAPESNCHLPKGQSVCWWNLTYFRRMWEYDSPWVGREQAL